MFQFSPQNVSTASKTLSVCFFIREVKSAPAESTIFVRLIYDRQKVEFVTGIRIAKETWCEKRQESKVSSLLNKRLLQIRNNIYDIKLALELELTYFNVHDIKRRILHNDQTHPPVLDYYLRFMEEKKKSGECTRATMSKYPATFNYLKKFLEDARWKNLKIHQWNKSHINAFDNFLKSSVIDKRGTKMALSTVKKHHVKLKTMFNQAVQEQLIPVNPYNSYKLKFPYKNREYLNANELRIVEELDLTYNKSLEKARDLFLFSCYTGLRFQDAQQLSMSDLTVINDLVFLRIKQGKTGEMVEIPLMDSAMRILQKYANLPERLIHNKALPQLSNAKTNYYLKAVSVIAGLQRPICHHMARHTCATTVLLDNDVSMEITSKILGHTSIRTTQIYGRITHKQISRAFHKANR